MNKDHFGTCSSGLNLILTRVEDKQHHFLIQMCISLKSIVTNFMQSLYKVQNLFDFVTFFCVFLFDILCIKCYESLLCVCPFSAVSLVFLFVIHLPFIFHCSVLQ